MSEQKKQSLLAMVSARPQNCSPQRDRWPDTLLCEAVQQIGQTILRAVNGAGNLHVREQAGRVSRRKDERETTEIASHDAWMVKVVFFVRIRKFLDLLDP